MDHHTPAKAWLQKISFFWLDHSQAYTSAQRSEAEKCISYLMLSNNHTFGFGCGVQARHLFWTHKHGHRGDVETAMLLCLRWRTWGDGNCPVRSRCCCFLPGKVRIENMTPSKFMGLFGARQLQVSFYILLEVRRGLWPKCLGSRRWIPLQLGRPRYCSNSGHPPFPAMSRWKGR